MGKKLYIKTYGCQMNEYDSDKTVDILKQKKGVEVTNDIKAVSYTHLTLPTKA